MSQYVRLPDLNRIQSSYFYLLEKEEEDDVTITPNRIIFNVGSNRLELLT